MDNIEARVKKVMGQVFNVRAEEINDESSPYTVKGWDSLKHTSFMLALEAEFKIKFEPDEIFAMVNYHIIISTIAAYL